MNQCYLSIIDGISDEAFDSLKENEYPIPWNEALDQISIKDGNEQYQISEILNVTNN